MKRKVTMILITLLSLALVFSGCGQQTAAPASSAAPSSLAAAGDSAQNTSSESENTAPENDGYVLKVGYSGSLCEAPVHIAYENGFFEEEGLTVELILLAPGTANDAVTAGKTEAGFGLLASLVQPLSNGLPIKITTGLHTGCDKILVPGDSGINTAIDLRGKRIGVPSLTSSPIIFAKRVLADNGVGVNVQNMEVEFLVFTNAELPAALEKGAIDAIAANDPTAYLAAVQLDLDILYDSSRDEPYKDQYCCSAYVRENIAAERPDIAAKYTRAMQRASAWVAENPDEATRIQVEKNYVAGDAESNAAVLKTYNYIPSVSGAYEAFGITAKKLQEVEMLDANVDVDALQQNSFAFFDDVPDTVTDSGRNASDVK
ncbi:MAG: ABC transporter substrate-binding protein [Oscillospiraceae bacterium]|jgi:NitT/TauT family transport system substrate-binding protein|nr:ABC transporter substrate-binding protein [Oscillospiraceae bacterium]